MPHAESPSPTDGWNELKLYVNDGELTDDIKGPLKVSHKDMPMDELRKRYAEDGYIFVRGLIPRKDVLKAREEYFTMLAPTGVLKPGTEPVEGIFDDQKDKAQYPGLGAGQDGSEGNSQPGEGNGKEFLDLAEKAHYEHWYKETFCRHPDLFNFIAEFSGWGQENTLGVTRTLLRNNTPGNRAIGVHYDQIFLRYGDPSALTAWVPMGDISLEGGGLIYLENACDLGQEIEKEFTDGAKQKGLTDDQMRSAFNQNMMGNGLITNDPADFARKYNKRWLVTAYEAGDVVLHDAYMIHASTMNWDPKGVIRVGTDLRFVDTRKPWDTRWDKDFKFGDGV